MYYELEWQNGANINRERDGNDKDVCSMNKDFAFINFISVNIITSTNTPQQIKLEKAQHQPFQLKLILALIFWYSSCG